MMPLPYFIQEFEHTRPRHGGNVTVAARIFGIRPEAVIRACERARKRGIVLHYINDIYWSYENERRTTNSKMARY